jgi:hypothetical protein
MPRGRRRCCTWWVINERGSEFTPRRYPTGRGPALFTREFGDVAARRPVLEVSNRRWGRPGLRDGQERNRQRVQRQLPPVLILQDSEIGRPCVAPPHQSRRSQRDVTSLALPVQKLIAQMDPDLPVSDVLTMEQIHW